MKFFEFCRLVLDQEELVNYMQRRGVLKRTMPCDKCHGVMSVQRLERAVDGVCFRCARCKTTRSIRSGSFLEYFKMPLPTFAVVVFLLQAETLLKHIAELLDLSERAVIDCANLVREQFGKYLIDHGERLGGDGVVVQVLLNV
jgi:hypothetical protein